MSAVNAVRLKTYWDMGKRISETQAAIDPNESDVFISQLSTDLTVDKSLLYRIIQFYKTWPDGVPSVDGTVLSWTHHVELLSIKDKDERQFYLTTASAEGWGRNDLRRAVRKDYYKTIQIQPTAETGALKRDPNPLYVYKAIVEDVVDGDTLLVRIDLGFSVWVSQRVRFRGINTAELVKGGVPVGTAPGRSEQAKAFVQENLKDIPFIVVKTYKTDMYGRYVADVFYHPTLSKKEDVATKGIFMNQELLSAGNEYWSSRDFAQVLGYNDYRNFEQVIQKARTACFTSGHRIEDHFVDVTEMVGIGSGAQREVKAVFLSRYACYLVIQNADPSKEIVALGQTYFAVQTRRQELSDQATEDVRRLLMRDEIKVHNMRLAETAKRADVITSVDYAIFQNHGYMGLYGGMNAQNIHRRKKLKKGQQILDHMGSTELAANLFRATQTEEKIRREKIVGKEKANLTHREVGAKVRQTIRELGGTMPEHLPPAEDIKKLRVKQRKELSKGKPALSDSFDP